MQQEYTCCIDRADIHCDLDENMWTERREQLVVHERFAALSVFSFKTTAVKFNEPKGVMFVVNVFVFFSCTIL